MTCEAPKIGSVARQAKTRLRDVSIKRRGAVKQSGGPFELALLGDALVRLGRALDAVLLLVAVGREEAHHF